MYYDACEKPTWCIPSCELCTHADFGTALYASSILYLWTRKSKKVGDGFGILFVLANINNIYNLIFGGWYQGVVLFKYTILGNAFMKRSVKRSIYIQIVLYFRSHFRMVILGLRMGILAKWNLVVLNFRVAR